MGSVYTQIPFILCNLFIISIYVGFQLHPVYYTFTNGLGFFSLSTSRFNINCCVGYILVLWFSLKFSQCEFLFPYLGQDLPKKDFSEALFSDLLSHSISAVYPVSRNVGRRSGTMKIHQWTICCCCCCYFCLRSYQS